MKTTTIVLACLFCLPLAAWAQDGGDGGGSEPFDMEGAIRKVGELLKESERLLVESLQPGTDAKEAAERVEAARKAMDELLNESKKNGQEATKLMADIVKNAPQGGGGGGQSEQDEKEKEGKDPKNQPEDEVEKKDPKNSKDGDPESGEESKEKPARDGEKPVSAKDEAADPDLEKEWLATLPPEVRKAFENRNWDAIPPKWREVIRKYMKELAETDNGD